VFPSVFLSKGSNPFRSNRQVKAKSFRNSPQISGIENRVMKRFHNLRYFQTWVLAPAVLVFKKAQAVMARRV